MAREVRTLARAMRRHSAEGTTGSKIAEIGELCMRATQARQRFIGDYWDPRSLGRILGADRQLVEERRRFGWPLNGLSAHQNKLALETALSILRGSWRTAIRHARASIQSDHALAPSELRWCLSVLGSPDLLQECLLGGLPTPSQWAGRPEELRRLSRRLRRRVFRIRGGVPRLHRRSIDVDTNLYRPVERRSDRHFRGAWLAVTGLRKGRRTMIPLAGAGLEEFGSRTARQNSRPGMRIEVIDGRIVFNLIQFVRTPEARKGVTVGIDKGFRTLVTLSDGDPATAEMYGADAASVIAKIADVESERQRERRRLVAYERSLRNTDPAKAHRIRRRNLGVARSGHRSRRARQHLREQVDRTLNELFDARPDVGTICVEDLTFRGTPLSRELNRRLGRWLKGYLHQRLAYKAELNGVELKVVTAAYTSQACPRCSYTSKKNRAGDAFVCGECRYVARADAVAATNVLRWGSDSAIARTTSYTEVKQILEGRWRTARNGRAWGSSATVLEADVAAGDARCGSREQPPGRVVLGQVHTALLCSKAEE